MIITAPPADVFKTALVEALKVKDESGSLLDKVNQFVPVANQTLDFIVAGPFREYTLHNRDHAKKLIHISGHLIPREVFANLSALDCAVIIFSCYLHDMGMCCFPAEREKLLVSEDFRAAIVGWPEIGEAIKSARRRMEGAPAPEGVQAEVEVYQLHEAVLSSLLRKRHATKERYQELVSLIKTGTKRDDLFTFNGVSFEDHLIDVCVSHNLDAAVLSESRGLHEERFPRRETIGHQYLNSQYCAAILRLADILDFDRERTPQVLFEGLGIRSRSIPGAEVTLKEWEKHMSIHSIEITPEEVVVSAECKSPVIEKAIRDFCAIIEREIRDTTAVIKRNIQAVLEKYWLDVPLIVRPKIRSIGYIYKDVALRLNQAAIGTLLMGYNLYSTPMVAIRELIQNAIDAVRARLEFDKNANAEAVRVFISRDEDGRYWLNVEDLGIGMDEHVICDYLLCLGNSYYSSGEFVRVIAPGTTNFSPISKFGIGFASVFMIGDVVSVETQSAISPRRDYARRRVRIEGLGKLAYIQELGRGAPGTRISIRLTKENSDYLDIFWGTALNFLLTEVMRPSHKICIESPKGRFEIGPDNFYKLNEDAVAYGEKYSVRLVEIDVAKYSERLRGVVILGLPLGEYKGVIRLGDGGLHPNHIIDRYAGNRISVNGFRMSSKKLSTAIRSRVTAAVIDIDIVGNDGVAFDVERKTIMQDGRMFLVKELRSALALALKESGIFDELRADVQDVVSVIFEQIVGSRSKGRLIDEQILNMVLAELPSRAWPIGIHRTIADKLGLKSSLVHDAISALIESGKAAKPTR